MGLAAGLQLETLAVRLVTDLADFDAGLRTGEQTFNTFVSRINTIAASFSYQLTAHFSRTFVQFDELMTKTMSIMENGTDETRRILEDHAFRISSTGVTAPRELAQAYYSLTAAGYSAAQSLEALGTVERFAAVNTINAGTAATQLIRLQRGLNLISPDVLQNAENLARVGDVITAVGIRSQVSVESFLHGMERLSPTLRFMNMDLEQGAALLATYTSQGMEAGAAAEMAGRTIMNIQRLFERSEIAPGQLHGAPGAMRAQQFGHGVHGNAPGIHPLHAIAERARQATHAWRNEGIEVFDAMSGRMLPFIDILRNMENRFRGVADSERQLILQSLGLEQRNARGIIALLGQSDALERFDRIARNSSGMMETIYSRRLESFSAQWKILSNNLEIIGIEVGRVVLPFLRELNALLSEGFMWWRAQPEAFRAWVIGVVLVIGAITALRVLIPVLIGLVMYLWRSLIGSFVTVIVVTYQLGLALGWLAVRLAIQGLIWPLVFALAMLINTIELGAIVIGGLIQILGILGGALFQVLRGLVLVAIGIGDLLIGRILPLSVIIGRFFIQVLAGIVTMVLFSFISILQFVGGILLWLTAILLYTVSTALLFTVGLLSGSLFNSLWLVSRMLFILSIQFVRLGAVLILTSVQTFFFGILGLVSSLLRATTLLVAEMIRYGALTVFHGLRAIVVGVVMGVWALVAAFWNLGVALLSANFLLTIFDFLVTAPWLTLGIIILGIVGTFVALNYSWQDLQNTIDHFTWENIQNGAIAFFWGTIGLLYNFRENWSTTMTWLGQTWTRLMDYIFDNFENLLLRMFLGMGNWINGLPAWGRTVLGISSGGGSELLAWATRFFNERHPNGVPGELPNLGLPNLRLNFDIPEDVRRLIQNIPGALLGIGGEGGPAKLPGNVGDQFKEMSLRRFALDTNFAGMPERTQQVRDRDLNDRADTIIDLIRRAMGLPPRPAVGR